MPPTPTPPPSTGGRNLLLGIIGAVIVVALIVGGVLFVQHSQSTSTSSTGGTNGATATPSQHVAFQDALTSDANQWNVDSTCFFSGGGYHINGSEACFNSGGSYGDASISVDVKQTSGDTSSAHGIVLRRGSAGNFYGFEIDAANDWAFYKYTSDQSTEIQSPSSNSAIKSGLNVTNTLKITASGSHFTFFVNGTQVGQADDTGYASGRSGLDGQDGSEVVYNNFKVTTP